MIDRQHNSAPAAQEQWLRNYYFTRAAFSAVWVALAFSMGRHSPGAAAVLLIIYPAWDALANYIDMARSGGMAENRTQVINALVSVATMVAVIAALGLDLGWVLGVFGIWAILSGLLQLGTAVRRWKRHGAQWAMILSGAQSALAGTLFIVQGHAGVSAAIARVAGYAAVGAVYFLVSAVWLTVGRIRRKAVQTS